MTSCASILTSDLNAAFAPIAARLKQVEGVRAVRGVTSLAQALDGKRTGTDGYVYLIYAGERPTTDANRGRQQKITVSYQVLLALQSYDDANSPFGTMKARIIAALNGYSPLDPDPRSRQRLRLVPTSESDYFRYGYALHPLKFEIDFIIEGENP